LLISASFTSPEDPPFAADECIAVVGGSVIARADQLLDSLSIAALCSATVRCSSLTEACRSATFCEPRAVGGAATDSKRAMPSGLAACSTKPASALSVLSVIWLLVSAAVAEVPVPVDVPAPVAGVPGCGCTVAALAVAAEPAPDDNELVLLLMMAYRIQYALTRRDALLRCTRQRDADAAERSCADGARRRASWRRYQRRIAVQSTSGNRSRSLSSVIG